MTYVIVFVIAAVAGLISAYLFTKNNPKKVALIEAKADKVEAEFRQELAKLKSKVGL